MLIKSPKENDMMSSTERLIGDDTAKDIAYYLETYGGQNTWLHYSNGLTDKIWKDKKFIKHKRNKS